MSNGPSADDTILQIWIGEARLEVSRSGWEKASVNALLLVLHDKSSRADTRLERAMRGPIRWFVGLLTTALIWIIVRDLFIVAR